ncbi:MAG: polyphosphate kinase 1 [Granulosicoccus sp.]|nr:polyphosphate kinase 1 [Granulosicoccus sp.]
MNFLAHSLLGFDDDELIAGQICGDFVRGSTLSHFPVGLETGIRLHRHLDAYTDSHPGLVAARAELEGVSQRFAGIIIDVLFDHFLAQHWSRFSAQSLPAHASTVHAALDIHRRFLPDLLQRFMPVFSRERILERNTELPAIEQTLARLSRRSPRFAPLAIDGAHLLTLREQLQEPFESFYPDLLGAARAYLDLREQSHPQQAEQQKRASAPPQKRKKKRKASGASNVNDSKASQPATLPEQWTRSQYSSLALANRELSFLAFDERVLALASDANVPLLERLRFLCISSSNLDEFFEIRVAGLKQKILGGIEGAGIDGMSPLQEMDVINREAHALVEKQYQLLNEVLIPELAEHDIRFFTRKSWSSEISTWVKDFFTNEIAPVLSPLGLDPAHPFPRLTNKSLNFIIDLRGVDAFGRDSGFALVRAPRSLPRVIRVPSEICGVRDGFVFLSSIVHSQIGSLFNGMNPVGVYQFKATRNSDLYVSEEEVANLRRALESELVQRNFGQAVRLEVAANCPNRIVRYLQRQFQLEQYDVYRVDGPVNLNRLLAIPDEIDRPDLKYPSFTPHVAPAFQSGMSIFENITQRSPILFHHPYESYVPVIDLVRQAAADPDVLAIKQTLYRTGHESVFVSSLMEASRRGKDVTVVIELRARFDEAANIELATRLQEAGIQVVYGVVGFKTHAKMLLVVRREKKKLVKYVHVGTGNYHATTARAYTDISMLTNSKAITEDVHRVFTQLTGLGQTLNLKQLVQAPFTLHTFIVDRIARETKVAAKGGKGHVIARMNSLVDPGVIQALYEASQAGVKVELVVRGICMLKAQVPGLSENIRVISVLGRFLEHSRVFWFLNEGKEQLYISSADWMPRNFFNRVEIAVPLDGNALDRVKEECLEVYLKDNVFAWEQQADGTYRRLKPGSDGTREGTADKQANKVSEEPFCAQQFLIDRYGGSRLDH